MITNPTLVEPNFSNGIGRLNAKTSSDDKNALDDFTRKEQVWLVNDCRFELRDVTRRLCTAQQRQRASSRPGRARAH